MITKTVAWYSVDSWLLTIRGQAVAGPRLGDDERGAAVLFELGAEPAHVDAQVFGLGLVAVPPDPAQQVRVGEELAPVDGQLAQQRELGRGQVDRLAAAADLLAGQVDGDITDPDHRRGLLLRRRGAGAPERSGDPGEQFLDAERLGHVVVG